jgi:hypothetical protein
MKRKIQDDASENKKIKEQPVVVKLVLPPPPKSLHHEENAHTLSLLLANPPINTPELLTKIEELRTVDESYKDTLREVYYMERFGDMLYFDPTSMRYNKLDTLTGVRFNSRSNF